MKTILDLVKANTELNSLSAKLDEALAGNQTLQAQLEEQAGKHAEEVAKLGAQHEEDIKALETKVALLEETNLLLEQAQATASEQAADIVAQCGAEPVEEATEPEPAEELSQDAHWDKYRAIEGREERRAYYLKHIKPLLK
jgi:predicted nuclease with TOPRIM domain